MKTKKKTTQGAEQSPVSLNKNPTNKGNPPGVSTGRERERWLVVVGGNPERGKTQSERRRASRREFCRPPLTARLIMDDGMDAFGARQRACPGVNVKGWRAYLSCSEVQGGS